jgi:hypothetical protein
MASSDRKDLPLEGKEDKASSSSKLPINPWQVILSLFPNMELFQFTTIAKVPNDAIKKLLNQQARH